MDRLMNQEGTASIMQPNTKLMVLFNGTPRSNKDWGWPGQYACLWQLLVAVLLAGGIYVWMIRRETLTKPNPPAVHLGTTLLHEGALICVDLKGVEEMITDKPEKELANPVR